MNFDEIEFEKEKAALALEYSRKLEDLLISEQDKSRDAADKAREESEKRLEMALRAEQEKFSEDLHAAVLLFSEQSNQLKAISESWSRDLDSMKRLISETMVENGSLREQAVRGGEKVAVLEQELKAARNEASELRKSASIIEAEAAVLRKQNHLLQQSLDEAQRTYAEKAYMLEVARNEAVSKAKENADAAAERDRLRDQVNKASESQKQESRAQRGKNSQAQKLAKEYKRLRGDRNGAV